MKIEHAQITTVNDANPGDVVEYDEHYYLVVRTGMLHGGLAKSPAAAVGLSGNSWLSPDARIRVVKAKAVIE